jgi:hypothetical protein
VPSSIAGKLGWLDLRFCSIIAPSTASTPTSSSRRAEPRSSEEEE